MFSIQTGKLHDVSLVRDENYYKDRMRMRVEKKKTGAKE